MNRRKLLQNIGLGIGGMVALPTWATAWNINQLPQNTLFCFEEENILEEIVGTVIPKTDTLGAKEIGVAKFVIRMVMDCYEQFEQENFKKFLQNIDKTAQIKMGKSYVKASQSERVAFMSEIQSNDDMKLRNYLVLIKRLTIQGYLNSEYVMTNLTKFEFAPARFHGCVPIGQ